MTNAAAQLSTEEPTAGPVVIEWDPDHKREVEAAKRQYQAARARGDSIVTLDGHPVTSFRPALAAFRAVPSLNDNQVHIRIIDDSGDRSIIWDSTHQGEVDAAARIFAEYLAKGWKGYAISRDGSLKRRVLVFSALAEEIVLVDPKDDSNKISKTKVQFIREFGSLQALPKTWKG